jgi:hypothetical protein
VTASRPSWQPYSDVLHAFHSSSTSIKMANCYYLHSSIKKINYDDLPCEDVDQTGRNATCCVRGSTCMSNGLCQNAGGDGYYSGDCTDPTLEDPVCQIRCGQYKPPSFRRPR